MELVDFVAKCEEDEQDHLADRKVLVLLFKLGGRKLVKRSTQRCSRGTWIKRGETRLVIEERGKAKGRTERRLSFLETRNRKIGTIRSGKSGIIGSKKSGAGRRRGKQRVVKDRNIESRGRRKKVGLRDGWRSGRGKKSNEGR